MDPGGGWQLAISRHYRVTSLGALPASHRLHYRTINADPSC